MTQPRPRTSVPLPDLADEAATRRNYEFYLRHLHAPRIDFETYALAYGEKADELRTAYERFCADLRLSFPGVQAEYFAPPTYEEFKQAFTEDNNA
jgi:hypothetical protein